MSDELANAFREAIKQREAAKDKACEMPPSPFDWAHSYEHKTIYHDNTQDSGYTASVCSKCGFEHPLGVTYFARITLPIGGKT